VGGWLCGDVCEVLFQAVCSQVCARYHPAREVGSASYHIRINKGGGMTHYYPDTPYTLSGLTALMQVGRNMQMARKRRPAAADAGMVLIDACRSGNWFTAVDAAQSAIAACDAPMQTVKDALQQTVSEGNQKIVYPYLLAKEKAA
jgi:hypothetical protein